MSKILVDLDEARLQFGPAIWGGSDLNDAQAKQLAKKLVTLLEQRCRAKLVKEEKTSKEIVLEGVIAKCFPLFPDMLEENGSLTIAVLSPKVKSRYHKRVEIIIKSVEEE